MSSKTDYSVFAKCFIIGPLSVGYALNIYIGAVPRENQHYGFCEMYRPDQPALSAQTDPGRHIPSQGD